MKKNKWWKWNTFSLLGITAISLPIVLTSCSDSNEIRERFKINIEHFDIDVTQEAIDVLGTDLYRVENGLNVLDLSWWRPTIYKAGLNAFTKPVEKLILRKPNLNSSYSELDHFGFFPNRNSIKDKKLNEIALNFRLKNTFEIELYENSGIRGLSIPEDSIINESNYENVGAFPIGAFNNVTKIIARLDDSADVEYASLANAFRQADQSKAISNTSNGKDTIKYFEIVSKTSLLYQFISAVISFKQTSNGTQFLKYDTANSKYVIDNSWPFVPIIFTNIDNPSEKMYISDKDIAEAILNGDYKKSNATKTTNSINSDLNYQNNFDIYNKWLIKSQGFKWPYYKGDLLKKQTQTDKEQANNKPMKTL